MLLHDHADGLHLEKRDWSIGKVFEEGHWRVEEREIFLAVDSQTTNSMAMSPTDDDRSWVPRLELLWEVDAEVVKINVDWCWFGEGESLINEARSTARISVRRRDLEAGPDASHGQCSMVPSSRDEQECFGHVTLTNILLEDHEEDFFRQNIDRITRTFSQMLLEFFAFHLQCIRLELKDLKLLK